MVSLKDEWPQSYGGLCGHENLSTEHVTDLRLTHAEPQAVPVQRGAQLDSGTDPEPGEHDALHAHKRAQSEPRVSPLKRPAPLGGKRSEDLPKDGLFARPTIDDRLFFWQRALDCFHEDLPEDFFISREAKDVKTKNPLPAGFWFWEMETRFYFFARTFFFFGSVAALVRRVLKRSTRPAVSISFSSPV